MIVWDIRPTLYNIIHGPMMEQVSKIRKCSVCKEPGHNKRTCPQENDGLVTSTNRPRVVTANSQPIDHCSDEIQLKMSIQRECLTNDYVSTETHGLRADRKRVELNLINAHYRKNREKFTNLPACVTIITHNPKPYPDTQLWYTNQQLCSCDIETYLLDHPNTNHILICAQMGSGKSALINRLSYMHSCTENYTEREDKYRPINHQFIITGYSSKEYESDMKTNINFIPSEYIFHRNNIHFLKEIIVNKPERLINAVFYIDEARIVVEKGQTINTFYDDIGLSDQIIRQYNIIIYYIDATPDSLLITLNSNINDNVAPIFKMDPGDNYNGIKYMYNSPHTNIHDIVTTNDIANEDGRKCILDKIVECGKNAVMRITTEDVRNKFIVEARAIGIECVIKSTTTEWASGFHSDFNVAINKDYSKPIVFIVIQMYTCSKRLTLSSNIGVIYDQQTPGKFDNSTVQGLLGRFFGYYDMSNLNIDIYIIKRHFDNYIQFIDDPEGKIPEGYTSRLVKKGVVLIDTYHSSLVANTATKEQQEMNLFIIDNPGIIFSGTVSYECNGNQPDEAYIYTITNGSSTNNGETFTSMEYTQNRINYISTLFSGTTYHYNLISNIIHKEEYVNKLGTNSPSSNYPIVFRTWKDDPNNKCTFRVHSYKINPDDPDENVKFHLRWMVKKP